MDRTPEVLDALETAAHRLAERKDDTPIVTLHRLFVELWAGRYRVVAEMSNNTMFYLFGGTKEECDAVAFFIGRIGAPLNLATLLRVLDRPDLAEAVRRGER